MTNLDDIYLAEPRLVAIEALIEAIASRGGAVPWNEADRLLSTFLGVRRDASVIAANTGAVQAAMPRLRDEAIRAQVGHRLRDLAASMDAGCLAARR